MKKILFRTPIAMPVPSIGLLIHRLIFGGFMLTGHGWAKLSAFSEKAATFPDPLGIGSEASMAAAVFAEFVCASLVLLGVATRFTVIPLIFTMGVAALVVHGGGPLFLPAEGAREPALLYLFAFSVLIFTGAGRYSIDGWITKPMKF